MEPGILLLVTVSEPSPPFTLLKRGRLAPSL